MIEAPPMKTSTTRYRGDGTPRSVEPSRAHAGLLPMSSAYLTLILRDWGTSPKLRAALPEGTGISADSADAPPPEITLGQQLRQVSNACRLFDPDWALLTGARFHAITHGPIGAAAV